MERVRLATASEVEGMKGKLNLDASCTVFAFDTPKGTFFAVRRLAVEIDPMIIPPEADPRMKFVFARDLEHIMMGGGISKYFFQVPVGADEWIRNVEKFGAEQVSTAPEFRYEKVLVKEV